MTLTIDHAQSLLLALLCYFVIWPRLREAFVESRFGGRIRERRRERHFAFLRERRRLLNEAQQRLDAERAARA